MPNTRFKGATADERLSLSTLSDSDMFQARHMPGTANDADKGVSKAVLQSVPIGICTTAAATQTKTVSLATESCPDFALLTGREVLVYLVNGNTHGSPFKLCRHRRISYCIAYKQHCKRLPPWFMDSS